MRLSTYICTVIAPVTTLVIVHSGCSYAEFTSGTGAVSRINEETGTAVFNNDRKTSNCVKSQTSSPLERTSTGSDLVSQGYSLLWKGVLNRHVGGKSAKIEEFPFVASLEYKDMHCCTMCIVTESWLLTAGHCTIHPYEGGIHPTDFTVTAGSSVITTKNNTRCVKDEVTHDVDELVWHPGFSVLKFEKDLVLVHVSRPLPFSERIQPATLPSSHRSTQSHLATGSHCQVVGWSPLEMLPVPSSSKSKHGNLAMKNDTCKENVNTATLLGLQKLTLPVISSKDCSNKYPLVNKIVHEKAHICTDSYNGQDACSSDSGSLLVCNGRVVALVSFGSNCRNVTLATVYMRIDSDVDWIRTTVHPKKANMASPSPNVIVVVTLGQLLVALARICHA